MATATLTFDLSDVDDEREHKYALAGRDALIALERIDNWAREQIKYGEIGEGARELLEHLRQVEIPHELMQLLE